MEHLLKIIEMHANSKTLLANKLADIKGDDKISSSHINNWLHRDKKIPAEWVLPLSESADWAYTPHQLRPDIYIHPDDGLPTNMRCKCEDQAA